MKIILMVITTFLPIFLGYFFKLIKLFSDDEVATLRKFVIKVSVPFIIIKNLYKSNMESLIQIFPAMFAFIFISILFTITAYLFSFFVSKKKREQNAYAFSVFVGNYGYLGWGVLYYFYGDNGFTRAVFFTVLFWPVFLTLGFWLLYLRKKGEASENIAFKKLIFKNASIPIGSSVFAIFLNLLHIPIPNVLWHFIEQFAAFTIPMILFTIGLNFKIKMHISKIKVIFLASFHRLILGFLFGYLTFLITKLFFNTDLIMEKVILLESIMPTAAMAPFFSDYIETDKELLSGVVTFSTLFSLLTIPFWYYVIEKIV